MVGLEDYSGLVVDIYDQSGTPDQWQDLLTKLTGFIGGRVGQLAVFSEDGRRAPHWAVAGHDPDEYRIFLRRHAKEDPRLPYILANQGKVVRGEDGVSEGRFRSCPLYQEVVVPFDIEHSLVSLFVKEGDLLATLATMRGRSRGRFGDEEAARFGLVVPHLRRAFELYALLDRARVQAVEMAALLDLVDAAVFLTDGQLRVFHANKAAEALIKQQNGVFLKAGRLTCMNCVASQCLLSAAEQAIVAAEGRHRLSSADHLEIPRMDGTPYRVSLHPLPRDQARQGPAPRARLAVIVRQPDNTARDAARRLQCAFKLTPSEAALAASMAQGRTLEAHAQGRGVAITTVRTQLQALYAKTATCRQAELVAMLRGNLDVTLN